MPNKLICQLFDLSVNAPYGGLVVVRTLGEAERVWDYITDSDDLVKRYPKHFEFRCIGEQDEAGLIGAAYSEPYIMVGEQIENQDVPVNVLEDRRNEELLTSTEDMVQDEVALERMRQDVKAAERKNA